MEIWQIVTCIIIIFLSICIISFVTWATYERMKMPESYYLDLIFNNDRLGNFIMDKSVNWNDMAYVYGDKFNNAVKMIGDLYDSSIASPVDEICLPSASCPGKCNSGYVYEDNDNNQYTDYKPLSVMKSC